MRNREIYMFGLRGFPNVQGGVETHAENLAPRLVERGLRVTVCMRSPYVGASDQKAWKGVRILRLWTLKSTYFETMLHSMICAIVAGFRRPMVVHIHGIGPAIVTPLLRAIGLRVVVTHHGEDYKREKWGWAARSILRVGELFGMLYANKRIAVSRSIGDLVEARYGRKCEVIPNGVELPAVPRQSDRVADLGLQPGRYILTVGRLVPEKRQLDLLRAFSDARLAGWKLAIVGKIDHTNDYADLLRSEAARCENVVMAGFQTGEPLRQLYAHAGLFVLPSSHEGLPIVLLEALSYGLPVLVSDIASNLEVVGDPAHIFRAGDCDELRTKLSALTVMKWTIDQRDAVRRESNRRYDWADITERTLDVYNEILTRRNQVIGVSRAAERRGERLPVYGVPASASSSDSLSAPHSLVASASLDLQ
jgi:glycosyltransferase involved in cell wall biosynthesis